MSTLTIPQARVPIGWSTGSDGARVPVLIDPQWMMAFLELVSRAGGVSGDEGIAALLPLIEVASQGGPQAQEALRGLDDLRHELASARGLMQDLRSLVEEHGAALASLGATFDLRSRVESIEDRLQ